VKHHELRQRPELGDGPAQFHGLVAQPAERKAAGCVPARCGGCEGFVCVRCVSHAGWDTRPGNR
jgi:hypothetical protein